MLNYLVVGASSGIGSQLVKNLLHPDNRIYATYSSQSVNDSQSGVEYHHLDVLQDELKLDFLPDEIHGLVYCPGSINLKPFTRLKPDEFVGDYQLQVVGAIKVIQAVLPKLKLSSAGSIVLFSTVAVQMGFNFHTQVATSKGAIEGLTRSLAAELAPDIRVNCIAPSITDTRLAGKLLNTPEKIEANAQRHPLKRIGEPDDIANAVEFLISDKSGWITGQIIHVDGGMSSIR